MRQRKSLSVWHWLALAGQLGFALITPIILCTVTAYWLSRRFALGGWIVIVGILIGLGGAAVSFVQVARLMQRAARKREDEDA